MSFFLLALGVVGAYLVIPYYNQVKSALEETEVEIKGWDLTSYREVTLSLLGEQTPKTTDLVLTDVSITTEYFFEFITKFSSLFELKLNHVSFQSAELTCNHNALNKLLLLTIHDSNWPANQNEEFLALLLRSFPVLQWLKLDNSPQITATLTENFQRTGTKWTTIINLYIENCGFKDDIFPAFLQHFPKLRSVKLNSNEIGAGFENWGAMENLLIIEAQQTYMTSKGLVHVIKTYPKLQSLSVTGEELIDFTNEQLQTLEAYEHEAPEGRLNIYCWSCHNVNTLFCKIENDYLHVKCYDKKGKLVL